MYFKTLNTTGFTSNKYMMIYGIQLHDLVITDLSMDGHNFLVEKLLRFKKKI
jgi:cytidylate kinase